MNIKHWIIVILLALWAILGRGAETDLPVPLIREPANTDEKTTLPDKPDEDSYFGGISVGCGGVGRSDVESSDAAYSVGGVEIGLSLGPVGGAFKTLSYSWEKPELFPENTTKDDPWERLNEASVSLTWSGEITKHLQYTLLGGVTSGYEEEPDDSFSYFAGGYGTYNLTPTWSIAGGGIYSRHQKIETDFDFIPVAGLSWNAEATNGLSLSLGIPTTEVSWHFSKKTTLTLDMSSYEGGVYRLANDSPIRKEGYVEFFSSTVSLRLDTTLGSRVGLSASVFQSVSRDLKLYDSDGENRLTYKVDNNPGFMLSLFVAF